MEEPATRLLKGMAFPGGTWWVAEERGTEKWTEIDWNKQTTPLLNRARDRPISLSAG